MNDTIIKLEQIDTNSSIDGLYLLNSLSNDKEAPIDQEIDEYLYKEFLKLSEEEIYDYNRTYRYWVCLKEQKIGYSDIVEDDSEIGRIGLILLKRYRNKGLGKVVLRELLYEAYSIGLKEVHIVTDQKNTSMVRLCESIGASTINTSDSNHYCFSKRLVYQSTKKY